MTMTLAFDVYGTLIDTHGLVTELREFAGDRAGEFSRVWREKQLEYSFRRGLMHQYETFAVCTRQALDYTSASCNVFLTSQQKSLLLDRYAALPAFSDVASALDDLRVAGFRLFAFSNGTADAVETLFHNAGIREYFLDVLSVDDLCSFKPNPAVYSHFLRKSGATAGSAWLISSNPFDVIGAISAGMRAAWVKRSPDALFDPWGIEPTLTVAGLEELCGRLQASLSGE